MFLSNKILILKLGNKDQCGKSQLSTHAIQLSKNNLSFKKDVTLSMENLAVLETSQQNTVIMYNKGILQENLCNY